VVSWHLVLPGRAVVSITLQLAEQEAWNIVRGQKPTVARVLELEKVLNRERRFGLARKILQRVRNDPTLQADWKLRLKLGHRLSLNTYKDPDLPTDKKLQDALEILRSFEDLQTTNRPCSSESTLTVILFAAFSATTKAPMKGLPSGPLTLPVIVAANAGDSGPVSNRETSERAPAGRMEVADRESLQASWARPKRGINSPSSSFDDESIMVGFEGLRKSYARSEHYRV
jgi:hypothetical protein